MIVSLHVATGAALGTLTRSRLAALALGPPLHLACDRVPHEDIHDRRFEIRSGLLGLALLALTRGPLDPATFGAAAASAPDLEHVVPWLRPHGHRLLHRRGWHRAGGFRADVQLVLAGTIIGLLLKPPRIVRDALQSPPASAAQDAQPRRSGDGPGTGPGPRRGFAGHGSEEQEAASRD